MKRFLSAVNDQLALEHVLQNFIPFKKAKEGLNAHRISENLASDLQMFFSAVANAEINSISLEDTLFLFKGLRKIPPFGLHKQVGVFFCYTSAALKISTCGYTDFVDTRVGTSTYICNKV